MVPGLAISGKKLSGKDTVHAYIAARLVRPVVRHKWADALKEDYIKMLAAVGVKVTREQLDDNHNPDKALHVKGMQWYGTDFWRRQDPDYWVRRGLAEIEAILEMGKREQERPFIVNTDSRFPNEIGALKQRGFITVRLTVSPERQSERAKTLGLEITRGELFHESETALDDYPAFDYIIDADKPLAEMLADIEGVLVSSGEKLRGLF